MAMSLFPKSQRGDGVLIVEDDAGLHRLFQELLKPEGYEFSVVSTGRAALRHLKERPVSVVLTDLHLPDMHGCDLLARVTDVDAKIRKLVMTGYGTMDAAVAAMKAGAVDFITKPFAPEALLSTLRRMMSGASNSMVSSGTPWQSSPDLIGIGATIDGIRAFIRSVADSDSTVLIQGESGTGKELVARLLHLHSHHAQGPFIPVNCGAIPESLLESELFGHEKGAFTGALQTRIGRFEAADGGTLFLDEIGDMPLGLQVKLLRVLQERCYERVGSTQTIPLASRIIAATNQDLEDAVQGRRFRADLFYRLNVIPVTMPTLRSRREDIPTLIEHYIERFNRLKRADVGGIEPEAVQCLSAYDWPGNVRELENLMERLIVLKRHGRLTCADLPAKLQPRQAVIPMSESAPHWPINLPAELDRYETQLILNALDQANGVTSRAAELLHLNRTTLVEKLKRKGLEAKPQRPPTTADLPPLLFT